MRATKAKALRQQAHMEAVKYKLSGTTLYQDKEHKQRKIESGMLNPNGTKHYYLITPVTRSLAHCERKVYQDLKNQ